MGLKQLFSRNYRSYIKLQPEQRRKKDETIFSRYGKICGNRFWYVAGDPCLDHSH
jgi:hypothetical protein